MSILSNFVALRCCCEQHSHSEKVKIKKFSVLRLYSVVNF